MGSITFAIKDDIKPKLDKYSWVNWSELVRKKLVERERMAKSLHQRLHSKEEKELVQWSVELGREAKKDSLNKFLEEIPKEIRAQLAKKHK
jgi:hypothetical protein